MRTVRLPLNVDAALEEEAGKRGMTMNSFIVSILAKYNQWDKLAERFRFVGFPQDLVREGFGGIKDKETLKRLAREAGARLPREIILFWFKDVTLEYFLDYLGLQSKFQGFANYEIIHRGTTVVMVAKHQLGANWSLWLETYLAEAIRTNLGVNPSTESSANSVRFEFEI